MIYRFNTNIWNKPIGTSLPWHLCSAPRTAQLLIVPQYTSVGSKGTPQSMIVANPYSFMAMRTRPSKLPGCQAYIKDIDSTKKLCHFYWKDEALKKNRVNSCFTLSIFSKKRVSISRIVLCKANPGANLSAITALNTINKRGLNLWFKRKKRIISCFAFSGENDSSSMPEKTSKTQVGLGGPSIWLVEKVQSLTEKLLHTKNFSSTSDKRLKIIPNKHFNQKFESKLYAFGHSHYQLQKNISKIEIGLRQGCQLFTIYVFGSFCWLYLIRYSRKTNGISGQVDFLFQDILFETLPLLSKKESLINKETINYANNPIKKGNNTNETPVSIELTPLFSEKLQNYIGKKHKNGSYSPFKEGNKVNQNKTFLSQSFSFSGSPTQKTNLGGPERTPQSMIVTQHDNLIFFARKPIFMKETSEVANLSRLLFLGPSRHPCHGPGTSQSMIVAPFSFPKPKEPSQAYIGNIGLTNQAKPCSTTDDLRKSILDFLFFKKQTLTQKTVYDLSGTSVLIDSEIDYLPRKLEEISFSKTGSLSKAKDLGPLGALKPSAFSTSSASSFFHDQKFPEHNSHDSLSQDYSKSESLALTLVQQKTGNLKRKDPFSLKFKPHLTLTESLLWCKTLRKSNISLICGQMEAVKTKIDPSFPSNNCTFEPFSTTASYNKGKYNKQTMTEELLLHHLFLKTVNFKNKGLVLSLDIFKEPRLQSGFQFPNATIFDKNKAKLKEGLGITINPQCFFSKDQISRSLLKKQENNSKFLLNSNKESNPFSYESPVHLAKESSLSLSSVFEASPCYALGTAQSLIVAQEPGVDPNGTPQSMIMAQQAKGTSINDIDSTSHKNKKNEKDFLATNTFLEWLYEPNPKLEYLFYSRANEKLVNLQKKASLCLFVVLDKHTDLKTRNCFIDKNLSSHKTDHTVVEKVFSYKRNSFTGLLDAPENFFGTPYLKLGERFTIEKLKSKNKMGTFYSIHNGECPLPWKKSSKGTWHSQDLGKQEELSLLKEVNQPYASMGTSLKTVFGKKQFTTPQNQTSKKISKVQNLITNARLVTNWSRDYKTQDLSRIKKTSEIQDNNFLFSRAKESKIYSIYDSTTSTLKSSKSKQTSENQANNVLLNKAKIVKLSYFKRISGKANRNITLPFKYYNPGIKRERNIEDTMLILEGYKKSRLFPTIHNDYRGIAIPLPITIGTDKVIFREQDYELQSILLGMRQRTETQRRALNLSDPSSSLSSKEKSEKELAFSSTKEKERFAQKHIKQNKKPSLSNYYPLLSSLAVCPQEAFPIKALGNTNINLYNSSKIRPQTLDLKGSIQTKGFYFEKLSCSESLPFLNAISFLNQNGVLISPNFLAKIIFFAVTWYSYKLLATPLSQSTQFLPGTFTEAIGLQSFQQKYRIIKGEKKLSFSFKNIAGAEKTLSELRDLIWTFRLLGTQSPNRKDNLFTLFPYIGSRFGQSRRSVFSKSRNRLLLAGPPGTGKTLLVKALAAEANLPVIVQPVSSLRMISGVENPVSALFHVARQIKPCIIFLDELDTLGNDINANTNNYTAEQKLGIRLARKYTYTLLLELDGLTSSTKDLLIIGATNRLETLNPALTRAGRFDTILDFNLPSQEALSALFSFYLGKILFFHNQEANKKPKQTKTLNLVRQKQRNSFKETNFKLISKNSFSLESYLAGKCYGLSHASIGTIINESALEAMLSTVQNRQSGRNSTKRKAMQKNSLNSPSRVELSKEEAQNPTGWPSGEHGPGSPKPELALITQRVKVLNAEAQKDSASLTKLNKSANKGIERSNYSRLGTGIKPYHTLDTLERAINSVKTLTRSRHSTVNTASLVESDNTLSLNSNFVPAHEKHLAKVTVATTLQRKVNVENPLGLNQDQVSRLIKPFNPEFLVNRAYQKVGPLIFSKKSQEFSSIKTRKSLSKISSLSRKSYLAINQKHRPVNRKDLQNVLLQEYSACASLSIYRAVKPLTFKITGTGLYQDPSYIAATLSTLRILTDKSSFSWLSGTGNTKVSSSSIALQNTRLPLLNQTSHLAFESLFSGFVKESNLPKVFFSNTCGQIGYKTKPKVLSLNGMPGSMNGLLNEPNLDSSYAEQIEQKQKKSLLFWQTKTNLKSKGFSSNSGFNKYNKQGLTHIMDVKAANPLTTSWFRIYFSRPFFRYDTFHYIENKEYFPKNNYILKRNALFQRNVSTLSHTRTSCNSPLNLKNKTLAFLPKETTEKKGKPWSKENKQVISSFLTSTYYPELGKQGRIFNAKNSFVKKLDLNCSSETKESLYLAIVASIFHRSIQFFEKNRELTDYCVYTFLRYGVLYDFYLEAILRKF